MSAKSRLGTLAQSTSRWLLVIASLVALGLTIAWMSGTFHDKTPPGEMPYERPMLGDRGTSIVSRLKTLQEVDAVGTVQPLRKTDVASRTLATINEILVNPGDQIQVGQQLCVLDDREIQAQLREAEAAATGIEADLVVRERDFERNQRMFAENAVTKEDLDRVVGAYKMAQSQLQRTREQVNRIKIMLTYAQITAHTAGEVADRYMDPGDLAVPGKPILTIHDPNELELHANVREGLAGSVHVGMKLSVTIDALSRTMTGTVREIVPRAQANSRSLLVKISLPTTETQGLYIGMFGRLSIPVGELDRVVVDNKAVQWLGQLSLVQVVQQDGSLERRFICTGQRFENGKLVEVLSGLSPDDIVALPEPAQQGAQNRELRDPTLLLRAHRPLD